MLFVEGLNLTGTQKCIQYQLRSNCYNTMQSTVKRSVRESFTERGEELLNASGMETSGSGVSAFVVAESTKNVHSIFLNSTFSVLCSVVLHYKCRILRVHWTAFSLEGLCVEETW